MTTRVVRPEGGAALRPALHIDAMTTAARQGLFFVGTVCGLCLALAFALPRWELTPLIAALLPAVAVVLVTVASPGHGKGRSACAGLGFRRPRIRDLLIAVGLSAAVSSASFAIAAAIGVVDIPSISPSELGALLARAVIMTAVFTPVFLCEEVGCSARSSQQRLGMGVIDGSRTRVDHYAPPKGL